MRLTSLWTHRPLSGVRAISTLTTFSVPRARSAEGIPAVADDRDLVVLIGGRHAGVVTMDAQGRLTLRYDEEYLTTRDPTAWHTFDTGQFSLAGAQAKTALHQDPATRRWGEPQGATPTTHILKPAVTGLDEHDLNEHLCLRAADLLGLPAASSYVGRFGSERVIVVERYDRLRHPDGTLTRIHQEDMCQALGRPPTSKYQNEGGPTPEQIITVLRENVFPASAATEAVNRFVDALAYNWIIGGTDAHAKNYSVLLSRFQVRLARLYDVASTLPYDDMYVPKLRMAMKIGGEYGLDAVHGRHWRRFAQANQLDPDETVARLDDLATRTPDAFTASAEDEAVQALKSQLPSRLTDRVAARAAQCRKKLEQ